MTDLRSRLHDVVDVPEPVGGGPDRGATAHDDVVVGALTTRVRRRRAVRAGALGAVGALTITAVVVGGAAMADRLQAEPAPPATEAPAPDGVAALVLDCGDRVPAEALHPVEGDLWLVEPEIVSAGVAEGEPLDVRIRLRDDGERSWDTRQVVQLAALRDGTVVATGSLPIGYVDAAGIRLTARDEVEMGSCEVDGPLPAGDYQLVAAIALANADGSDLVGLSSGPVPFTVAPAPPTAAEEAAAQDAVNRLVAGAAPPRVDQLAGACGTVLATDPDPLLRLEMTLAGSSFAPGALIEGDAAISAREGLSVLAIGPITAVHAVLVRDGVVVGRGEYDPEYLDLMTFTDQTAFPLPAYANAIVCTGPDAAPTGLGLPSGTYQAYGLYEVAIREVQRADGSTEARSDVVTLVSDPVDVVIGAEG